MIKRLFYQQGFLSIVAIFLIVIMGFVAVTLTYMTATSAFSTINFDSAVSAFWMAESGLEDAKHELLSPNLDYRSPCASLAITNSMGEGQYSVTSTGPFYVSSPTTLNGALDASSTTITVTSTANYQNAGRILIDQEWMDYSDTDANHFLLVQRGTDGSTATSHSSGVRIGQYQCNIVSTGGVPTLTFTNPGDPGGKKILKENMTLQEAWGVGNRSGNKLTFMRWNRPTELNWNNASVTGNINLNDLSLISYVDGWAVGASKTFYRWNGSTWSSFASGLSNVTYNGVFCFATNNCHAVGNMVSTNSPTPVIADWNGIKWTATTLNIGSRSGHQLAVHCAAANDCWSVGNMGSSTSTSYFYRWNGTSWSGKLLAGYASGDFPFRSVFCNNTSNCWAVGNSSRFAFWNGTNWTAVNTGLPSVAYNSVYCNHPADCWAVGNVYLLLNMTIAHWNGSTWSLDSSAFSLVSSLNSVTCSNSTDCWAGGNTLLGQPLLLHWDGDNWNKVTTSGLANQPINAIVMLGPNSQPGSGWSESFS